MPYFQCWQGTDASRLRSFQAISSSPILSLASFERLCQVRPFHPDEAHEEMPPGMSVRRPTNHFLHCQLPPKKKSPHFWRCLKALNRRLESMERRLQQMNLDNLKAGPGDRENREKLGKCLVEMELTGQEACHICNHIKLRRIKLMLHQWVYRRRGKFAT